MRTYDLLCVDCAEALTIGKIVKADHSAISAPWSTTGWRQIESGEWMRGGKQWELVERFFILHRGHELRVLPELAVDSIDPESEIIQTIHNPAELLGRPVVPEPHPEEDLARIDSDVIERIKRRVRAVPGRE